MQPHLHKTYTAADIERYHNGTMPAGEMHALEKAALDDPFLSDALDGYVHTETPAADVAFLKQQLAKRGSRVFILRTSRQKWLAVAALIILLAGFGWIVFTVPVQQNRDVAAHTEAAPQTVNTDTALSGAATPTAPPPAFDQQKEAVAETGTAATDQNNEAGVAAKTFSPPHVASAPTARKPDAARAKGATAHTFKARVLDANRNAIPFAIVISEENKATTADVGGNVAVTAPDSTLTITVRSTGFEQQQTTLNRTDSETTIVLQRAANRYNAEAVITKKNIPVEPDDRVRLEGAEPVDGWRRFNAYFKQNQAVSGKKIMDTKSGEVIVLFDVDTTGKAVNIAVEKPLCAVCDSTAVRMIRDGGNWKKTFGTRPAKAYIRF